MNMKFAIIGGDKRSYYLAKLLVKEKHKVLIYGFDNIKKEVNTEENIVSSEKIDDMILNSEIVVLPIPITKDNLNLNMPFSEKKIEIQQIVPYFKDKMIFAGNIPDSLTIEIKNENTKIIDIMGFEEFAILNAIPTAEATIEIILKNTRQILQNGKCLIMGYGRIGKVLARKLEAMSAKVTCAVTDEIEKAWCIAYGYNEINFENIKKDSNILKQYDIIINTIPKVILKNELKEIKPNALVIDLASKPYGIDREIVKEEKINFIEALGLPRKNSTNYICEIYKRNYI